MTLERCFYPADLQLRDNGDGRTLVGPLLPWGVRARVVDRGRLVTETFTRGALEGTDPARVPLTATHPRDAGTLPIGVMVEFEERADAAHGAWHVSDTMIGNEVLALARDGVPLGLSVGFAEVPGGSRWSADRQHVTQDQSGTRPRGRGACAGLPRRRGGGRTSARRAHHPGAPHPARSPLWLGAASSAACATLAPTPVRAAGANSGACPASAASPGANAARAASKSYASASAASHDD